MVPLQSPYPFNPASQMSASGMTYTGDSRAMLGGRAVSMGTLREPPRTNTSPQEEDKRRRAASASARFRRRKKEQEEENLKEIQRLEKRIEDLKKEYFP
jgi:Basic region leucine zipper